MIFIPDKFSLEWETESLKNRNIGVSESLPLTNTAARFLYNTYGAHTCKYQVNWKNYTKRDLNLKWPNWRSFDISKLIFLCAQLEKAGHAYFDWYIEASKRGNDRVTSSQETNKKLLETISDLKKDVGTDSARSEVSWNWEVTFGIYAIWLLISGHLFAFCFRVRLPAAKVLVWFGLSVQTSCTDCSS